VFYGFYILNFGCPTIFMICLGLVITPRWGLLDETYHRPRATLGAVDLRTFGAKKSHIMV